MDSGPQFASRVRFGNFEVDFDARELFRDGVKVKLNEKPFQVLAALVERPGQLVRRDELRSKLWPADTYVDFDSNVNTALSNLRHALGDSAESPLYIETVPRQGYRFIAQLLPWVGTAAPTTSKSGPADAQAMPGAQTRGTAPSVPPPPVVQGVRQYLPILLTVILVAGAAGIWIFLHSGSRSAAQRNTEHVTVFVVPFENLSGDPSQDYLSDGMTDEVITQLGQAFPDRLSVIARTTAMQYKAAHKSVAEIAREQHVDYVLEGTLQKQNNRVRITAQFFRGWDEGSLWTESFDRYATDLLSVEQEVANHIVDSLPVSLPGSPKTSDAHTSRNPEAYDDYLKGLFQLNKRTPGSIHSSIDYFSQATQKDPNFAAAYAFLANAYETAASWNIDDPRINYPKAAEASEKALALDKSLPEAHMTTGVVLHEYKWDWAGAEAELKRTIAMDKNSAVAHRYYAEFLTNAGRYDEALAEVHEAQRLDPLSLITESLVCFVYLHAHRYDDAISECNRVEQLDPNYLPTHLFLGEAYAGKHDYAEAIHQQEVAAKANGSSPEGAAIAAYYAAAGRKVEANKILSSLLHEMSGSEYVSDFGLARIYMNLGDPQNALRMLEKAFDQRCYNLVFLIDLPDFDPLHNNPEFQQMVTRRGFPATATAMLHNTAQLRDEHAILRGE
jgi:TolB-like protein/DNA-binding winged helix-turn-helix (wHTH) protein/Flp pilus assembly protein TadD